MRQYQYSTVLAMAMCVGLASCGGGDDDAVGPPAAIAPVAGNANTATIGSTPSAPGVQVTDAGGRPVAGAQVDFSVAANNGTLTGTSATTDAQGIARVPGWTLGALVGTQTVTAHTGSLSTTVSVASTVANGCVTQPAAVGLTTPAQWTSDDCVDTALGKRYDEYSLALSQGTAFKAQISGQPGREFRIYAADGRLVGDQPSDAFAPAAVDPLELQYVLPAGGYRLRVYAPSSTATGSYSMTLSTAFSNAVTDAATCRPVIFATFGSSVTQSLTQGSSCSFLGDIEDRYIVLLKTGEQVKIDLASTAFAPFLILRDDRTPTSPPVASDRLAAPGTASVTYTATFDGFHEIIVTSNDFVSQGQYTLSITKP